MHAEAPEGNGHAAADQQAPASSRWIRRWWGTTVGRRVIVWGGLALVVLAALALAVAAFSSVSGESPSYRDGFTSGGSVFGADSTGASPEQACRSAVAQPSTYVGPPSGGSTDEWIKGCVAGFDSAQSGN